MAITLYHPVLKETTEVPEEHSARVLEKSGWTRNIPKSARPQSEDTHVEAKEK